MQFLIEKNEIWKKGYGDFNTLREKGSAHALFTKSIAFRTSSDTVGTLSFLTFAMLCSNTLNFLRL